MKFREKTDTYTRRGKKKKGWKLLQVTNINFKKYSYKNYARYIDSTDEDIYRNKNIASAWRTPLCDAQVENARTRI